MHGTLARVVSLVGLLGVGACGGAPAARVVPEAPATEGPIRVDEPVVTLSAAVVERAPPPAVAEKPRSSLLRSGLSNPMSGGVLAGYAADTGLDIAGLHKDVFAIAAGTLDYAEPGHTLWTGRRDSHLTIRFELDKPIPWRGRMITHVYYGHLSKLAYEQREGALERRHVEAGERLGVSGVARGSPHLHVGLLLDGDVSQDWGTFLLADEVSQVLGGYRNGFRLPIEP